MYRYTPPKSSVWGHALRRNSPLQQQQAFDEFLRRTAGEYRFTSGSLMIVRRDRQADNPVAEEMVARFARSLSIAPQSVGFPRLNLAQFGECVGVLAAEPTYLTGKACHLMLDGSFVVTKWRIGERFVSTHSHFTLGLGTSPRLTTLLNFESLDQFRAVQLALSNLQLCRLDERHLKEASRAKRKRRPSSTQPQA